MELKESKTFEQKPWDVWEKSWNPNALFFIWLPWYLTRVEADPAQNWSDSIDTKVMALSLFV